MSYNVQDSCTGAWTARPNIAFCIAHICGTHTCGTPQTIVDFVSVIQPCMAGFGAQKAWCQRCPTTVCPLYFPGTGHAFRQIHNQTINRSLMNATASALSSTFLAFGQGQADCGRLFSRPVHATGRVSSSRSHGYGLPACSCRGVPSITPLAYASTQACSPEAAPSSALPAGQCSPSQP